MARASVSQGDDEAEAAVDAIARMGDGPLRPKTAQEIRAGIAHTLADVRFNGGPIPGCWCVTCLPPSLA